MNIDHTMVHPDIGVFPDSDGSGILAGPFPTETAAFGLIAFFARKAAGHTHQGRK